MEYGVKPGSYGFAFPLVGFEYAGIRDLDALRCKEIVRVLLQIKSILRAGRKIHPRERQISAPDSLDSL